MLGLQTDPTFATYSVPLILYGLSASRTLHTENLASALIYIRNLIAPHLWHRECDETFFYSHFIKWSGSVPSLKITACNSTSAWLNGLC